MTEVPAFLNGKAYTYSRYSHNRKMCIKMKNLNSISEDVPVQKNKGVKRNEIIKFNGM